MRSFSRKILILSLVFFVEILSFSFLIDNYERGKLLGVSTKRIIGGIVPHHLFVDFIIDDFFQNFSIQQPETIVLIGPNHYEVGDFKVLSSFNDWETSFGLLQVDKERLNKLIASNVVYIDDDVLINEHSISNIAPFIKNNLPKTKILPLVVSNKMNLKEIELLSDELVHLFDENIIFISSSDFSHYLKSEEAEENDEYVFDIIKNNSYSKLLPLDNDFLDSRSGLSLLLSCLKKHGEYNLELLYHTNSGEILNNSNILTTSYFSIIFY